MTSVTNNTTQTLNFVVGVKDGAAITEAVKAKETENISKLDMESAQVKGLLASGAITIGTAKQQPAAAKADNKLPA